MKFAQGADLSLVQARLSAALSARKRPLSWYTERWYPYPLLLSGVEVRRLTRLQELIYSAFKALVPRYLHDPRLQERVPMTSWSRDVFAVLDGSLYEPGALRPDFLIRPDGSFLVCEINGRFPLNGFFISLTSEEVFRQVWPELRIAGSLHHLRGDLLKGPTAIVKSQERGYDLFLFLEELEERGFSAEVLSLEEFQKGVHSPQVMLELHGLELQQLPLDFLRRFHREKKYFNDLRTVILGHDKRLLSILSDADLMAEFIPCQEARLLAEQIVPTFTVGRSPNIKAERWLQKPAHSGKGEGLNFFAQDRVEPGTVLQPEIEQKSFTLQNGERVNLVGLLPMWNSNFYGPGIFRAGPGPIVNLSDGGWLIGTGVAS